MYRSPRSPWTAFGVTLALGVGSAASARAQPATAITLESRAQALYQQGRERFVAGEFEQARGAFQSSLDTVDSPNTRMYLGRTLQRLGRDADAWAMLDRAARDADARAVTEPRYAPTRDAARAEADALAPSLAWLTLEVADAPDGLSVQINGAPLQRTGLGVTMPIAPGEIVVTATAPGRRDLRVSLALTAGQRELRALTLEVLPAPLPDTTRRLPRELPPPPPPPPPLADRTVLRVAAVASSALTVTAGALALGFFASALDARSTLVAGGGDEALRESGARDQDVARALGVAAVALFAGSLALNVFAWRSLPARRAPVTLRVSPFGVGGAF